MICGTNNRKQEERMSVPLAISVQLQHLGGDTGWKCSFQLLLLVYRPIINKTTS